MTVLEHSVKALTRRVLAACLIGWAGAPATAAAADTADAYPNRSIRSVSPFAPGGLTDSVRIVFPYLVRAWGQQIVIDNRPGAGTNIGTEIVVRAPPDGYTLLATTGSITTNPNFYPKLAFKPTRDLSAVVKLAATSGALAIHNGLPAKTLPEFIALARTQPGQLTLASAGTGTSTHLSIELLKSMAKIDVVHVPFKGGGGGIVGVMGGQLTGVMTVLTLVLPHHSAGKIRILAVTTTARSPLANDIPTFAEAGVPGYEAASWVGLFMPRGTPQPIINKWNTEINRIVREPEVQERFKAAGLVAVGGSDREFGNYFLKETERWAAVIKTANITVTP
jgi:tripartite-type tricarboxylate transporter receptor subunit TctC